MPRKATNIFTELFKELPDGNEWSVDRQDAWLDMARMALRMRYGNEALSAPQPDPEPKQEFEPPFYIDVEGVARKKGGEAILASDVEGPLYDLRGTSGALPDIIWADGSIGLNGADLTITAV